MLPTTKSQSTKFEFTEAKLRSIPKPDGATIIYKDTACKGLWFRVSHLTGAKTWLFSHRRPGSPIPVKPVIGTWPDLSVKDARTKAIKLKSSLAEGKDVLAPPAPKVTIEGLIREYRVLKPVSYDTAAILDQKILPVFGQRDPSTIRTHEVAAWHKSFVKTVKVLDPKTGKKVEQQVPAPYRADKSLDLLKALINFGMEKEFIPFGRNPCSGVDRHLSAAETERHYEWTDDELARLGAKLDEFERIALDEGTPFPVGINVRGDGGLIIGRVPSLWTTYCFRFIGLLGLRKSEALTLRWDQINETEGTITWGKRIRGVQTSKHKTARHSGKMTKIITDPVAEMLAKLKKIRVVRNPFVFVSADRKSHLQEIDGVWNRLRVELRLCKADGQWARIHDLRHWFGIEAAESDDMDQREIMTEMGHSDVDVSARYVKARRTHRFKIVNPLATRMAGKLSGKLHT